MRRVSHNFIARVQRRISSALGINATDRSGTVITMLKNNQRRAPGYWIQLVLATGIATLGLVLGSTAVVIGGMLVSPLMGPIIELAMGFAVGSSSLVVRAALRVVLSVICAVAAAALLTLLLPFHDITAEIASRTSPTALDLLIAIFCALTGAYTTVRPGADTTAAAAGTAIGIALVPPLCTAGFGIGTGKFDIARGAALLFTANVSGIVVFAVTSFLLLGYNQVDADELEAAYMESDAFRVDRISGRVTNWLRSAFKSQYGLAARLIIPVATLAAVYFPLKQALVEVTWEVHARDAVQHILESTTKGALQKNLLIDRHTITLSVIVVDSMNGVGKLERDIRQKIEDQTGVKPDVSVVAVPNAGMLAAAVERGTRSASLALAGLTGAALLARTRNDVGSRLSSAWPSAAGTLLSWDLRLPTDTSVAVTVRHIGPPLGTVGTQMLARQLTGNTAFAAQVMDYPLPPVMDDSAFSHQTWLDSALKIAAVIEHTPGVVACVAQPAPANRRARKADSTSRSRLLAIDTSGTHIVFDSISSRRWIIRISQSPCVPPSKQPVAAKSVDHSPSGAAR